ncbi:MAG: methyl-accepting chemotaxis protein [Bacteroidota bacterium]
MPGISPVRRDGFESRPDRFKNRRLFAYADGSDNVAAASQQVSSTAHQISEGGTEQASSVEQVSSSMEQMVANISQNTENAQETERIAKSVSSAVREVNVASQESLQSAKTIAQKISIITEISRQTNILALNAAVEAARAGEHGKGFAVVAAEVRKLAETSKAAADQINELAMKTVNVTENTGKMMNDLMPELEKTTQLISEVTAASLEQNSGAEQVNTAILQLNQITQQNAASSEEMAASSEQLARQAEYLQQVVAYFRLDNSNKRVKSMGVQNNGNHTNGAKVWHLAETSALRNGTMKGIKLDMGDQIDSGYEKF